jgi:hypothetical protein
VPTCSEERFSGCSDPSLAAYPIREGGSNHEQHTGYHTDHPGGSRSRLWPVWRRRTAPGTVGAGPETIRVLTEAIGARLLPDTSDLSWAHRREALFDVCCLLTVHGVSLADLTGATEKPPEKSK